MGSIISLSTTSLSKSHTILTLCQIPCLRQRDRRSIAVPGSWRGSAPGGQTICEVRALLPEGQVICGAFAHQGGQMTWSRSDPFYKGTGDLWGLGMGWGRRIVGRALSPGGQVICLRSIPRGAPARSVSLHKGTDDLLPVLRPYGDMQQGDK